MGAILDSDKYGDRANYKMRADYLASIREEAQLDDGMMKKTKIRRLQKSTTKSSLSGSASPRKQPS
jgi:hypothetical protein